MKIGYKLRRFVSNKGGLLSYFMQKERQLTIMLGEPGALELK